jgi:oligopeptide transport system ATP-binding protein
MSGVLVQARDIWQSFRVGRRTVVALRGVDLDVVRGEALGIVGETGSGKSTLARSILWMPRPARGEVRYDGTSLDSISGEALRAWRRRVGVVYQDPFSSLDPRWRVDALIKEPLLLSSPRRDRRGLDDRVDELMSLVGLNPGRYRRRRARELSGGEAQRVAIARAVACNPELLICDEPVSSLDASVQAQIINLLVDLRSQLGITCVFVSHDLGVVRHVCDRAAVMVDGQVCEIGAIEQIFLDPQHPYTKMLLSNRPAVLVRSAQIA